MFKIAIVLKFTVDFKMMFDIKNAKVNKRF